jgi:tetratricopeptide (TPR) repeat protein
MKAPPQTRLASLLAAAFFICAARVEAAPKRDMGGAADLERLEVARQHFQDGEALFAAGKLKEALVEYELSQVAHPSPTTELALGRVYERLERRDAALDAYQRVLAAAPNGKDADEARARIDALRAAPPAAALVAAPPPPPRSDRASRLRLLPAIFLGHIAIGGLIAGGALVGTVRTDVDRLQRTCAPNCPVDAVDDLRTRERAGVALLAIGGVALATDIVLWVLEARRSKRERTQALVIAPAASGLVAAGTF